VWLIKKSLSLKILSRWRAGVLSELKIQGKGRNKKAITVSDRFF
jgi:hypothetical protein